MINKNIRCIEIRARERIWQHNERLIKTLDVLKFCSCISSMHGREVRKAETVSVMYLRGVNIRCIEILQLHKDHLLPHR